MASPAYRLPRERLQRDIDCILSTGVQVKLNTKVGEGEYTMERLREEYDAVYIAIGAHTDKKVGIEGRTPRTSCPPWSSLGNIGDDAIPDFTGKKVCIIGGGNVAMDCTRSAIRCGAERVSIVYRRRKEDMTALQEEVDGAIAEGAVMMDLHAPLRIETDEEGKVTALWVAPRCPARSGTAGSAPPPPARRMCASSAMWSSPPWARASTSTPWSPRAFLWFGGVIKAENWTAVDNAPGVFAGGDCVTGPKTAIRAIAAGKGGRGQHRLLSGL